MQQLRRGSRAVAVVLAVGLTLAAACGDDDDSAESGADAITGLEVGEPAVEASDGPGGDEADAGEAAEVPDGFDDGNIVGGVNVNIKDYRFVVAIRVRGQTDNFCTGAVVLRRYVMTAAHCVQLEEKVVTGTASDRELLVAPGAIEVVVDRTRLDETETGQVIGVTRLWAHNRFDNASKVYDLAVLELAEGVPGPRIIPAGPSDAAFWEAGDLLGTLGWGCTRGATAVAECNEDSDGGLSPLKGGSLTVVDAATCPGRVHSTNLCMAALDASVSTCNGDSGGPWFTVAPDGFYRLVAVTSKGPKECRPGDYELEATVATVWTDQGGFAAGIWRECATPRAHCPIG